MNTDYNKLQLAVYNKIKQYTMTSIERVAALVLSVEYVIKRNIPGSFVECGVWKGGSVMAMALTLKELGVTDRLIYLYDTFEGMSDPTDKDERTFDGEKAINLLNSQSNNKINDATWAYSSLEEVKYNVKRTGYSEKNIFFIKGKVEDTIPDNLPGDIALLRLDTDWYESTKHELNYLYPHLSKGGVLIIDDYGYWRGSKEATDEYFSGDNFTLITRIDDTGRLIIKQ